MYYEGKGKILRQKAINLMYLIFLAFLFTYVPADFLDAVQQTGNASEKLSVEANKENISSSIYFLNMLKTDKDLYEKVKEQFLEVEDYSIDIEKFLSNVTLNLVSKDGVDTLGYFINGKKEKTTSEIMLNERMADSVVRTLRNYKSFILDKIGYEHQQQIDNMLNLPRTVKKSDGNVKSINDFYFAHTPLNVAVSNLAYFKGGITRIKIYVYRLIIKDLINKDKNGLPKEVIKNFEQVELEEIGNVQTLKEFFEKIQNKRALVQSDVQAEKISQLSIESLADTIYPEGMPFKFNINFDTASTDKVAISVIGPNERKTFVTTKPGPFVYLPVSKGRYTITFTDKQKSLSKAIRVIDIEPIIQNTKLSTIYIGIDNPLDIKTSEYGSQDQMVASITKGQIFRKGNKFYARVTEPGLVQVSVFAKMPYGVVKVAEQMFAVRNLNQPYAAVNNLPNGSVVAPNALKNMRSLSVVTDEYLVDEQFFIQEFNVSLIYNNYSQITKPFKNVGNAFNSYLIDLINEAKSGDRIMFSDIVAKSNLGTSILLNPYNIEIK